MKETRRLSAGRRLAPTAAVLAGIVALLMPGEASAAGEDCSALEWNRHESPGRLHVVIRQSGPQGLLDRLRECDRLWEAALRGIETGTGEWLDLARQLLPISDSHFAEDLGQALSVALPRAPARVFTAVDSTDWIYIVCGNGETLGHSPKEALAILAQRRRAVSPLRAANVAKKREACLNGIEFTERLLREHPKDWSWQK